MSDDVRDAYPEPDDAAPLDDPGQDEHGDGDPEPDLSAAAPDEEVQHTGNPLVDSVLDSLRELDALPVSEHVAVFEAAHERLRGTLADAGEPPAGS